MRNLYFKVRLLAVFSTAFVLLSMSGAHAKTGERVALILGNSEYTSVPSLNNPVNDASDISKTLEDIGFDVEVKYDLEQIDLLKAFRAFQRKAQKADIAIIYYAGHGIEVAKKNYLIPVDAQLETDRDIAFETVALETAVLAAEGAKKLSLVIVDACRNNPFTNRIEQTSASRSIGRGLALVEPTGNTLVAYAAKGGTTAADGDGRNSPYAQALIAALQQPGIEVGLMFRKIRDEVRELTRGQQEPFVYGSLSADKLFLNEEEVVEAALVEEVVKTPEAPKRNTSTEFLMWETIRNSDDPRDFADFIKVFPDSPFASFAQRRIEKLTQPADIPKVTEVETPESRDTVQTEEEQPNVVEPEFPRVTFAEKEASAAPEQDPVVTAALTEEAPVEEIPLEPLTRTEVREVQERLTMLEYAPGPIDGLAGRRTASAIEAFESAMNILPTGTLDRNLLERLRKSIDPVAFDAFKEQRRVAAAKAAADRKRRQQAAAAQAAASAQAAARAAAAAQQQQQQQQAVQPAPEPVIPFSRRKRHNPLEATDDDNSSSGGGSSSSGGSSSGGGSSGGGGGSLF